MGALHLVHGKVGVFFQQVKVEGVIGIPCHAAGKADVKFTAVRKVNRCLLQCVPQTMDHLQKLFPAAVAVEKDIKFIAGDPGA